MKNDALAILLKEKQELSLSMKDMGKEYDKMYYVGLAQLLTVGYMMINNTIRRKNISLGSNKKDVAFYRIKNMVYDYVIPVLVSVLWRFIARKIKKCLYR